MNLHRFTAQPKEFDIKEDIVRLDDLFREVDEVTGTPLSDIYKLSYFMCHFQSDTRPGVATRIATLDFTGCNYNDMFRAIYDLSVVAPVHLQHLKALTKTPKTKKEKSNEICRNFQKTVLSILIYINLCLYLFPVCSSFSFFLSFSPTLPTLIPSLTPSTPLSLLLLQT
jgi:hypothetical protein